VKNTTEGLCPLAVFRDLHFFVNDSGFDIWISLLAAGVASLYTSTTRAQLVVLLLPRTFSSGLIIRSKIPLLAAAASLVNKRGSWRRQHRFGGGAQRGIFFIIQQGKGKAAAVVQLAANNRYHIKNELLGQ